MEQAPRCHGILGLIFGHKFKDRYDTKESGPAPSSELVGQIVNMTLTTGDEKESLIRAVNDGCSQQEEVYVCDICVRCGVSVLRDHKP